MAIADVPAALTELVDRRAVMESIVRLQRGIDRHDLELLNSAFHDDADVAYGFFDGSAAEFAQILVGGEADPQMLTMHRPANVWIELDGDSAKSESYVFVYSPSEERYLFKTAIGWDFELLRDIRLTHDEVDYSNFSNFEEVTDHVFLCKDVHNKIDSLLGGQEALSRIQTSLSNLESRIRSFDLQYTEPR